MIDDTQTGLNIINSVRMTGKCFTRFTNNAVYTTYIHAMSTPPSSF